MSGFHRDDNHRPHHRPHHRHLHTSQYPHHPISHPEPNQTKPNQTKPNQTKPNQTKPNQTKPNQTKPNQTKPNSADEKHIRHQTSSPRGICPPRGDQPTNRGTRGPKLPDSWSNRETTREQMNGTCPKEDTHLYTTRAIPIPVPIPIIMIIIIP
ncbi:uncharacterized protein K489DRAFT_377324 [Dissoconium aciculare CBS 342.82]|uniref:Uncharacterized protein n=1 Tax=Dissoconium aciculare CBS 342.82 TaxID=1314786 RepID=A0A6J3M9U4_9PEZI|nr:uncharacterized protein K489DRAFT_377324 [Dissoconium aciculare CBS 342.82]KAF1824810.1 hypothetical protein K489DRAFT_377324 [Dissoconium aciculare CBS 342.82]